MHTLLDNIIRPIAKQMINQFGASVLLTRVIQGDYDTTTSSAEKRRETYTIKALVEDYNLVDSGAGFAAGLIEFGDKKITVAASALNFTPTAGDIITALNQDFTVIRVTTTYSGNQPAIFELQGRR